MADLNLPNPKATNQDDKTLGMVAHILAILVGFIGPLIIWLVKKDSSEFVKEHAMESLNFQLLLVIGYVVAGILICVGIGFILFPIIWVLSLVFEIQGIVAASRGDMYRYPLNYRLIK
jgi:uncharacterized Tic20 family protein